MRPPFQKHSPESIAAAAEIEPAAASLRGRVLRVLRESGPLTDEQIQRALALDGSTERPRRIELMQMGLVRRYGVGKTKSGRTAATWKALPKSSGNAIHRL